MAAEQHTSDRQGVLKASTSKPDFSDINPQDLANFLTRLDTASFGRLSATNIVNHEHPLIQDVVSAWHKLRSNVEASVVSDNDSSERFVTTIERLMALRNYHSATAILTGLRASGVKDMELPYVALLDSADNYTIYRSVVSKEPGLPFVYPHVNEMISACKPLSLPDSSECIGLLRAQGIEVETGGLRENTTAVTTAHLPDSSSCDLNSARNGQISAHELYMNPNASSRPKKPSAIGPSHSIPTLLPPRPLRPPVFKTAVYKSVGDVSISVDIYMPETRCGARTPIMLYIHGGGWVGGNRTDCSRLILIRFLQQGFVICSMDYRLLPESTFKEMQEDVRDIEPWLRQKLQAEVAENASIDNTKIVVVGASSGALLALQTPKYWVDGPTVIISLYGSTDLQNMPSGGRFSTLDLPQDTDILLSSAFDFSHPPTEKPLPTTEECHNNPRTMLFRRLYREERLLQLLLGDVEKGVNGKRVLLLNKSIDPQKVAAINPLDLCKAFRYPPTYQIIGKGDKLFQTTHVTDLHMALERQGVKSKYDIVPGIGHTFDTWAEEGGIEDRVLSDAILWVTGFVTGG